MYVLMMSLRIAYLICIPISTLFYNHPLLLLPRPPSRPFLAYISCTKNIPGNFSTSPRTPHPAVHFEFERPGRGTLFGREQQAVTMFLGLRGTKLQIAVGIIAGIDFLLFGYDQGVTGGLLNLQSFYTQFPKIDTSPTSSAYTSLSPSAQNHRTTVQGMWKVTQNSKADNNGMILAGDVNGAA